MLALSDVDDWLARWGGHLLRLFDDEDVRRTCLNPDVSAIRKPRKIGRVGPVIDLGEFQGEEEGQGSAELRFRRSHLTDEGCVCGAVFSTRKVLAMRDALAKDGVHGATSDALKRAITNQRPCSLQTFALRRPAKSRLQAAYRTGARNVSAVYGVHPIVRVSPSFVQSAKVAAGQIWPSCRSIS